MSDPAAISPVLVVMISIGTSALLSGFLSYVAFRMQFERFLARDTEREKHWIEWKLGITRDVEQLKEERNFHGRIVQCERFIEELRLWKHESADPHIRAMGALNERVTRLENAA